MLSPFRRARLLPRPSSIPVFLPMRRVCSGSPKISSDGAAVHSWLQSVVLKHGLCPWAARSLRNKALRIVTSTATDEAAVMEDVRRERRRLFRAGAPELSTTLLVCPGVQAWEHDFEAFDSFVRRADEAGNTECRRYTTTTSHGGEPTGPADRTCCASVCEALSLVGFHPRFARWRAFSPDLLAAVEHRGSCDISRDRSSPPKVWAHREEERVGECVRPCGERVVTCRRSSGAERAVLCSLDEAVLGARRALLQFDDGTASEEVVPIEWIVGPASAAGPLPTHCPSPESRPPNPPRALLAENWLHTCPAPVVHLLRSEELEDVSLRVGTDALTALQLRNARIARRLGGADGGRPCGVESSTTRQRR